MAFSDRWLQQRERNRRNVQHFSARLMWMSLAGSAGLSLFLFVQAAAAETAGQRLISMLAGIGSGGLALFWAVFLRWRRHFEHDS